MSDGDPGERDRIINFRYLTGRVIEWVKFFFRQKTLIRP